MNYQLKTFLLFTLLIIFSCSKQEGCTDETACNFDSTAESDDGSCTYSLYPDSGDGFHELYDCDGECIDSEWDEYCGCGGGVPDACGQCGGNNTCTEMSGDICISGDWSGYNFDCAGECFGEAIEDCAGECNGDAVVDCVGECNGNTETDECGNCEGQDIEYVELWGECYNIEETTAIWRSNDGLSGPIPPQIGYLINLTSLNIAENDLTSIPPEIGNLINLESIDMYDTRITESIPSEIGQLINLKSLVFGTCTIYQECTDLVELPPEIGNLTNLERLSIDGDFLSGELPSGIWNLVNLKELQLSGQFTGEIPSEIGNLVNLESLRISSGNITGEIPSEIGNAENLIWLILQDNQLTGQIPSQIANLNSLTYLFLRNNQLTGEVPDDIWFLPNLEELDFYNNQLTGEMPQYFCSAPIIDGLLNLGSNKFCPPYPNCGMGHTTLFYGQDNSECEYCIENPSDPDCD